MGKRLFIAVDLDEATREQVGRISSAVRDAVEAHTRSCPERSRGASWVRPDRMHLTLQFFGNADDALEERLRGRLSHPISEAAFDLSFEGLGFFPERGSPRVLWLGVRDGATELRRVSAALGGHESFTPHLTLARFRPATRVRDRASRVKMAEIVGIPVSAGPSRIDRVTLYESRLSPAGPTYLPLAAAHLQS